ncbi:MAG: CAP domain-containing protein [Proteobacteria bacterium]|nr:CAP domain-containing protein [Pseudomonadota bacterium]
MTGQIGVFLCAIERIWLTSRAKNQAIRPDKAAPAGIASMVSTLSSCPSVKFQTAPSLLLVLALAACAESHSNKSVPEPRIAVSQVTLAPESAQAMINEYRADHGLKPVSLAEKLTSAATAHARDMARQDRISHRGSDGSDPWARVRQTGYAALLAAENAAAGQRSFAEVLQGWKGSPGHNRNLLLRDATQMGIALATRPDGRYKTFWILVMGKPG